MEFPISIYEIDLDYHESNGIVDTANNKEELRTLKKEYKNERPYHYIFKDAKGKTV